MDGGSRCAFKNVAERDDGDDRDDVFYAYENIVTIVAHRRARQDKSLAECAESAFPKAALWSPLSARSVLLPTKAGRGRHWRPAPPKDAKPACRSHF